MSRCARIRVAKVPLHIVQRGNNRQPCFFGAADRHVYLALLEKLAARFECAVHAYVLMTNHAHLLVTPSNATGASLLMKHLGQSYVQHVNRTYERSGTLWGGRFRSNPVQCYRYLLACYRYIELNPVRAGIARHPEDYPWSSYRANAGLERSSLLTPHPEYLAIGARSYRLIFPGETLPEELDEIRSATAGSFALGDPRFRAEISALAGRRAQRGVAGRPRTKSGSVPDFRKIGVWPGF